MDAVGFFDGENRDDVRVIQRGDGASFALEAGEVLGVVGGGWWEDLEGDVAAKLGIRGAIHLAHATGADGAGNLVMG
jgi:hypothetical protein